jgi:hypothetical protein
MGSPSRTSTDTDCRRRACPARISIRRGYWIIVLPQQAQRDDRSQLDVFIISPITHVYYARLPWIKIKPTAQHTPARDNTLQQDSRYVHRIHLSSPGRRGISHSSKIQGTFIASICQAQGAEVSLLSLACHASLLCCHCQSKRETSKILTALHCLSAARAQAEATSAIGSLGRRWPASAYGTSGE